VADDEELLDELPHPTKGTDNTNAAEISFFKTSVLEKSQKFVDKAYYQIVTITVPKTENTPSSLRYTEFSA
jgi:hypothetical protein